jgi:hypothetical protein
VPAARRRWLIPPRRDRLLTEGAELRKGRLRVSSIYEWLQEDFGGGRNGVLKHFRQYAGEDLARALETYDGLLDDSYDWALNER